MAVDCLTDIIGVTNNTEIPFYDDLTEELQEAIIAGKSGLFMDSLPGGIDLMTVDEADYMADVLTLALKAKVQASNILFDELLIAINNRGHPSKTKFNGDIGRRSVSNNLAVTGKFQGHRYRMVDVIAGTIKISGISANISGSRTFNIYVGRSGQRDYSGSVYAIDEILYTFPITTVGGTWTDANMSAVSNEIVLPMEVNGEPQEYFIYFDRTEAGNLFPKNNEITCGGCSNGGKTLGNYMEYNGIDFADTTKMRNVKSDRYGHGLSVKALVGCDNQIVVCREYNKKDAVEKIMNWAALYKAGELWIEYIQKSGYVNKTNLQNREYLWGKRNHFRAEFEKRITTIANSMELGETNCYSCKDDKMYKTLIRA